MKLTLPTASFSARYPCCSFAFHARDPVSSPYGVCHEVVQPRRPHCLLPHSYRSYFCSRYHCRHTDLTSSAKPPHSRWMVWWQLSRSTRLLSGPHEPSERAYGGAPPCSPFPSRRAVVASTFSAALLHGRVGQQHRGLRRILQSGR